MPADRPPSSRSRTAPARLTAAPVALALLACLAAVLAPAADAAPRIDGPGWTPYGPVGESTSSVAPPTPPPAELPARPADFELGPAEALEIADGDEKVLEARRRSLHGLTASVDVAPGQWEIGFFDGGEKVNLVFVDGSSGEIDESWTGEQVAWPMARGRTGQFGHLLNAPWVWIPMALIFFLALFDFRRPGRIAHLDLAVLLSFGISQAFFNAAEIGISVPLYYPPLLYLLGRMLWIGFRGSTLPLRPALLGLRHGMRWAVLLCAVLLIFRVTVAIADSGVIDVGYAGVIGADKITDAKPIYGEDSFPEDNPTGDTYGPANYFAYVPFEQIFPWSGEWDELPAARAAALFFDLLCLAGLIVLGRRLAGNRLAATLAIAWLAYPYTDFVLQSNANDSLLAAAVIWALAFFAQPLARGGLLGFAAAAKFAPAILAPLFVAGERGLLGRRPSWPELREPVLAGAAFAVVAALFLAHPAIDPGLSVFYERTLQSQLERVSPFSIWGQADLELLHTAVKVFAIALALVVMLLPRVRDLARVAALGAAVTIALQIATEHWFYLYIVWFLPLLLLAIAWRPESPPARAPASGA